MATQGFRMIQDENLNTHFGGASFGIDANVSKTKKAALGLRSKPLTNITNSGKPSSNNVLQRNVSKKLNVEEPSLLVQHENLNFNQGVRKPNVSNTHKKAGLSSSRKALANITNSKKAASPQQASKKNHAMKLNDIAEEHFLHNHQECIKAQKKGMDMDALLLWKALDDDFSMEIGPPGVFPVSRKAKADFASPPRYLGLEGIPELPNEDPFSPGSWMLDSIPSPSPSPSPPCYWSPPRLSLLRSP